MTVGFTVADDLYREIILDHYRHPHHRGSVENPTGTADALNPICGDEVSLSWRFEEGRIADIAFLGQGCSISMASASLLCDALRGRNHDEIDDIGARFRAMLLQGGTSDELGDLEALQGVAAYPVRIKCAILAWNALQDALHTETSA